MSVICLCCSWYVMLTWGLWTALPFAKWPGSAQDSRIRRESQLFAAFESPQKPLTGVFLGDSGYIIIILSTILYTRNQQKWSYTYAHCVNVAVKVAVNCCFSGSTCINQLAPGSGCGGGSGSGVGITDDDTYGMPKHVPLVTYLN